MLFLSLPSALNGVRVGVPLQGSGLCRLFGLSLGGGGGGGAGGSMVGTDRLNVTARDTFRPSSSASRKTACAPFVVGVLHYLMYINDGWPVCPPPACPSPPPGTTVPPPPPGGGGGTDTTQQ